MQEACSSTTCKIACNSASQAPTRTKGNTEGSSAGEDTATVQTGHRRGGTLKLDSAEVISFSLVEISASRSEADIFCSFSICCPPWQARASA